MWAARLFEGWWRLLERYSWAELGGVLLHGAPPEAGPFRGLMLSTLSGWRGLPGLRGDRDAVPGGHGSFSSSSLLRDERSMQLTGAAVGDDPAAASVLLEQIEAACGDQQVLLRVQDDTGVWSRMVEVEFQPDVQWNRSRVRFTADLIAPDPVRYSDLVVLGPAGLPSQEGGLVLPSAFPWNFGRTLRPSLEVVNTGALPVYPVVRLSGSGNGLVVRGGPRRIEFGAWAGEFVIDNLNRRAFMNGTDVTRMLLRRDWQQVPAGQSYAFSFEALGSSDAQMTVEYKIGVW